MGGTLYKDLLLKLPKLGWFCIFVFILFVSLLGLGFVVNDTGYDSETSGTVVEVSKSTFNDSEYFVTYTYEVNSSEYKEYQFLRAEPDVGDIVTVQYKDIEGSPAGAKISPAKPVRMFRDILVYCGLFLSFVAFIFFLRAPTAKRKAEEINPLTGEKIFEHGESKEVATALKLGFKRFILFFLPLFFVSGFFITNVAVPSLFEASVNSRCGAHGSSSGLEFVDAEVSTSGRKLVLLKEATCTFTSGSVELDATDVTLVSSLYAIAAYALGVSGLILAYVFSWLCFKEFRTARKNAKNRVAESQYG